MDLKIKDVADLLNVSPTTIRRWVENREIPSYCINRRHYFSRSEIQNWMISHKTDHAYPFMHDQEVNSLPISRSPKTGGSKQFSLFRAIHKGDIISHLTAKTKEEAIRATMKKVATDLHVDADVMTDLLLDREALMPTALNNGIAVPHTRDSLLESHHDVVVVVFLDKPLDYGSLDGQLVHTLFFLFACEDKRHLHLLAKIAHLSSQPHALEFFKTQPSKEKVLSFIKEWEGQIPQLK